MRDVTATRIDFVIAGAQKGATTFLHESLRAHPGIVMPADETSIFESPYYEANAVENFVRPYKDKGERLLGIKRPSYLGLPDSARRIAAHNPDAKIFFVLRNPVTRFVAAYFHYLAYGHIPYEPIETGVWKVLDGTWAQSHPRSRELVWYSEYARGLAEWGSQFPRESLHILVQEELAGDAQVAVHSAARFLGLAPMQNPPAAGRRPQAVRYHPVRIRLKRLGRSLSYVTDETTHHQTRRPWGAVVARAFDAVDRLMVAPMLDNSKPRLDPAITAALSERFAPDVAAVEKLLGRRIPQWHGSAPEKATNQAGRGNDLMRSA